MELSDELSIVDMLRRLADHIRPGLVPRVDVASLQQYGPSGLGLFEVLIAVRNGEPVGMCLYNYLYSGWRGKPGIFINDLYVMPSERGTGLGKALLASAARREEPKGCSFIKLGVDKTNRTAIEFYQRLQFELDDHDHTMVLEGQDFGNLDAA